MSGFAWSNPMPPSTVSAVRRRVSSDPLDLQQFAVVIRVTGPVASCGSSFLYRDGISRWQMGERRVNICTHARACACRYRLRGNTMRGRVLTAGAAMVAGLALSPAHAMVTRDNFPPKSTADLVALCTAQQNDPLEAAAVNFCQGFAEGAVEIALSYSAVSPPSRRPFCLPTPPPSLDQAASDFASWAGSDPARLQQPAVVGLINYLIERYPCPHEAVTQRRPQK